jgi:hypothetical protein
MFRWERPIGRDLIQQVLSQCAGNCFGFGVYLQPLPPLDIAGSLGCREQEAKISEPYFTKRGVGAVGLATRVPSIGARWPVTTTESSGSGGTAMA